MGASCKHRMDSTARHVLTASRHRRRRRSGTYAHSKQRQAALIDNASSSLLSSLSLDEGTASLSLP